MSKLGGGMNFYGDLPDSFNIVLNTNHPVIEGMAADIEKGIGKKLTEHDDSISAAKKAVEESKKQQEGKKDEEISQEEKDKIEELNNKVTDLENKRKAAIEKVAGKKPVIKQLVDLALLANNMLKGEELSSFVKRSVELL